MRLPALIFLIAASCAAFAQGHDTKPAEALKKLSFMIGDWKGKQDFNTGGAAMVGEATNKISEAIGGRYVEERLSTALPGRPASDTRHFITFDPKSATYKAWWFNDSSVGAMELEGTVTGNKLVLLSKPTVTGNGQSSVMRATYESRAEGQLVYKLELKQGEEWQLLFTTTYNKG